MNTNFLAFSKRTAWIVWSVTIVVNVGTLMLSTIHGPERAVAYATTGGLLFMAVVLLRSDI